MRTWPALEVGRLSRPDLVQAALLDFDVAAIEEFAADSWRIFFQSAAARDRAAAALARQFPQLAVAPLDVPDEDWAARSQASLRAIQIGNIIVAPPWDVPTEDRLKADTTDGSANVVSGFPAPPKLGTSEGASRIVIVIQPSMGFGTGHHATTRLCLAALQALDLAGRSVIDVGTGSGVLAIAGSLLGADRVLAIDDDPDAIQAARENVALNSGASVDVRLSDLRALASSALHASLAPDPATVARADSHARFDVIFANLTGTLLSQTAALLEQLAVRDGSLVLSGFMRHEADDVLAAFSGCELRASSEEDEWLCVTLQSR